MKSQPKPQIGSPLLKNKFTAEDAEFAEKSVSDWVGFSAKEVAPLRKGR